MKKILLSVILIVIIAFTNDSFAQKQYKFGHIDSNELLSIMPERTKAKAQLETYAKQLENQLAAMQNEFDRKYEEYINTADSLSKFIRQTKEQELGDLQKRIQAFQQTAQQDLATRENELLQPIIQKARNAVDEVAAENNYTYVFDIGTGVILHWSEDSEDIMPLVKAKLGIQ